MSVKVISRQALSRMPYYLNFLKELKANGSEYVSAPLIAEHFNLNEVQVRKDLASVSKIAGSPKKGFSKASLIEDISEYLGCRNTTDAVLVGAGHLGKALLSYKGFADYGLNVAAAFDIAPDLENKKVFPIEKLPDLCRRLHIKMAIITVPASSAQEVCDLLIRSGITVIWNFAPIHLKAPENIIIHNENMAASIALLQAHLKKNT